MARTGIGLGQGRPQPALDQRALDLRQASQDVALLVASAAVDRDRPAEGRPHPSPDTAVRPRGRGRVSRRSASSASAEPDKEPVRHESSGASVAVQEREPHRWPAQPTLRGPQLLVDEDRRQLGAHDVADQEPLEQVPLAERQAGPDGPRAYRAKRVAVQLTAALSTESCRAHRHPTVGYGGLGRGRDRGLGHDT